MPDLVSALEARLFVFLSRKYVQRADSRQRVLGLLSMEAETHDLAAEIARFVDGGVNLPPIGGCDPS